MRTKALALLPILLLALTSCAPDSNRSIEDVLSQRKDAMESKNLELYLKCISPDYKEHKDGDTLNIEDVKKKFLTNVTLFDDIDIVHKNRTIYVNGNSADVAQKTIVRVRINRSKSVFTFNEQIGLAKNNGRWEIVKESEADFFDGFVYGGKQG